MKIEEKRKLGDLNFDETCKNDKNRNKLKEETKIISGIIIDKNHCFENVKEKVQILKKNQSENAEIYIY